MGPGGRVAGADLTAQAENSAVLLDSFSEHSPRGALSWALG